MAATFVGKGLGMVAAVTPQAITPAVFLAFTYRILLEDGGRLLTESGNFLRAE